MQTYECISFPAERGIVDIVKQAHDRLLIACPYLSDYGAQVVIEHAQAGQLWLLTNLDARNMAAGSLDLAALLNMWDRLPLRLSSLGGLHAKVYIADRRAALITSANLTRSGMRENYEYGVVVRDADVVKAIAQDIEAYFELGNVFEQETLRALVADVEGMRALQRKLDSSALAARLRHELAQVETRLKDKILVNRVRGGRTVNAIFSETIRYLLRTKGALTTPQLHALIQSIHPDICDDSIDRVINGEHFGKKWKHSVRNAQQYLKRGGVIQRRGSKWYLTEA